MPLSLIIIALLLVLFFILASSVKLFAWHKLVFDTQLMFFKKYGLNRMAMFIIGLIEMSGAFLLLMGVLTSSTTLGLMGSTGIAFTSIGALFFHFKFDTWKDAIPALVTLSLSSILILFL